MTIATETGKKFTRRGRKKTEKAVKVKATPAFKEVDADYSSFVREARKMKSDAVICGSDEDDLISVTDWIPVPESIRELIGTPGLPCGLITMVYGEPDCLSGDTFIPYKVYYKGLCQDATGGTLKSLYQRFIDFESEDLDFCIPSVAGDDSVFVNRIKDVIYSGYKSCFKIKTLSGFELTSTGDHRFFVGGDRETSWRDLDETKYSRLEEMSVGDSVYVYDGSNIAKDTIASIEPAGEMDTYDISCKSPFNNFIANGFVVHNCGKTSLCNEALAGTQKEGGLAILFLSELKYDEKRAAAQGVRCDGGEGSLIKYRPRTIEQVGDYIHEVSNIINKSGTKKKVCIVWDSLGATPCENELNAARTDFSMDAAKAITGVLRKTQGLIRDKKIAFVMINQVYDKTGVTFGKKTTTRGGKSPRYYSALQLSFAKIGRIRPPGEKSPAPFCGIRTKIDVEKNHLGQPFKSAEVQIDWKGFVIDRKPEYAPEGHFNSEVSE